MENKENNLQPAEEVTQDIPQQELPAEAAEVPAESTEAPVEDQEQPAEEAPVVTQEDIWEDQPVDMPVLAEEIGPDEQAVAAAGLTHPEDLEFEKIMEEALLEARQEEEAGDEGGDFIIPDELFLTDKLTAIPEHDAKPHPPAVEPEPAPAETPEEAPTERETEMEQEPLRKRRPKKRDTYGLFGIPHILTTVIWLSLIVFIGAGIGRMIWLVASDMLAFGKENRTVTITLTNEDDLESITEKLHNTGLINYPGVFKFYGKLVNLENKVNPGTYELNTIYDYFALKNKMSTMEARVTTTVTIPEGYTCAQIFRLLEKSGVCTVENLENAVMTTDLSGYWFLEGIEQDGANCLEGYLFPDTYNFYLDEEPSSVLKKLLNNFDWRFSDAMMEKLGVLNETLAAMMRKNGLPESYIQEHLFTIREVVIVASMIEKETAGDAESYNISSVIYNRLTNPGEYPFLNIDAALVYITGNSPLTQEDLKIDSPYNTYLYKGLIPGPISNPGVASLNAALSPESTKYYYYALNPETGYHEFFKTYAAHQKFLESIYGG